MVLLTRRHSVSDVQVFLIEKKTLVTTRASSQVGPRRRPPPCSRVSAAKRHVRVGCDVDHGSSVAGRRHPSEGCPYEEGDRPLRILRLSGHGVREVRRDW